MYKEEFKKGDPCFHKSSNILMVVLSINSDYRDDVICRYYNPTTGIFCQQTFKTWELNLKV